ncbi:biphenyl-2,3-diol 1,2-dioxygenase III-related protein [hydrothermal vent metagenome]|uniref:Biphenyl-2,3-diol 1,2-dioxygenase III-related protein n=1 Tax=hydrothermal vent metagenome TaxID=652676 RepID=A0A3B0SLK2_9ZZZZ
MSVLHLDHLVLTVVSTEDTCRFYENVLGMKRETFGTGRTALKFGDQKINLHEAGKEFEPKARLATPGSADLCFIVENLPKIQTQITGAGVEIIEGPVPRTGATGPISSIYIRDPDGNLLELATAIR